MCFGKKKQKKQQIRLSSPTPSLYSLTTERVQSEDIQNYNKGHLSVRNMYFSSSQPRQTIKLEKKKNSKIYWREEDNKNEKKKINLFKNSVNNKIDLKILVLEHKRFVRKPNYFQQNSNDISSISDESLQDLVVNDLFKTEEEVKTPKVHQFFYDKIPPRRNFPTSPKSNTEGTRPTKMDF